MAEDTRKATELCRDRRFEQNAQRAKGAQNIGVPEQFFFVYKIS